MPFQLTGIGGPGAPHEFTFRRRDDPELQGVHIENTAWGYQLHPHDVILLLLEILTGNFWVFVMTWAPATLLPTGSKILRELSGVLVEII